MRVAGWETKTRREIVSSVSKIESRFGDDFGSLRLESCVSQHKTYRYNGVAYQAVPSPSVEAGDGGGSKSILCVPRLPALGTFVLPRGCGAHLESRMWGIT